MTRRPIDQGLRGRLIIERSVVKKGTRFEVELELENVGSDPLAVQAKNAHAVSPVLRDAAGSGIRPTHQRGEVLTSLEWDVLQPGTSRRFQISMHADDAAASAQLDLTTCAWRLGVGSYRLSGSFSSQGFSGAPPVGTWAGTLDLPVVAIEVSP